MKLSISLALITHTAILCSRIKEEAEQINAVLKPTSKKKKKEEKGKETFPVNMECRKFKITTTEDEMIVEINNDFLHASLDFIGSQYKPVLNVYRHYATTLFGLRKPIKDFAQQWADAPADIVADDIDPVDTSTMSFEEGRLTKAYVVNGKHKPLRSVTVTLNGNKFFVSSSSVANILQGVHPLTDLPVSVDELAKELNILPCIIKAIKQKYA